MAQTNYPRGGCDDWDLTKFNDHTLHHEIELCQQNIFGVWLPQYNTGLKGMMSWKVGEHGCSEETLQQAQNTWLRRLRRAEDELFERLALV